MCSAFDNTFAEGAAEAMADQLGRSITWSRIAGGVDLTLTAIAAEEAEDLRDTPDGRRRFRPMRVTIRRDAWTDAGGDAAVGPTLRDRAAIDGVTWHAHEFIDVTATHWTLRLVRPESIERSLGDRRLRSF